MVQLKILKFLMHNNYLLNIQKWKLSYLRALLKVIITGIAIWFVFKIVDIHSTINLLREVKVGFFILAFIAFNISKIISSVRLNRFYNCIGLFLTQPKNLKLYYVGMFYNLFLPGSIGGDGYKVYLLKGHSDLKTKQLISATLMDRISGVSILLSISFFMLALILNRFETGNRLLFFSLAVSGSISVIVAYYYFLKWFLPYFINGFNYTTWLSFLVQTGQVVAAYFLLLSIGVTGSYFDYLLLFMLSSLASVLPFTIGGVGAREFVFLYGYRYLLIDKNVSIAFTSLFFVVLAVSALIGLFFSFNIDK